MIEDRNIDSAAISAPGTITFQDVDLIDTHTASFALKSTSANGSTCRALPRVTVRGACQIGNFAITAVNENNAHTVNTRFAGLDVHGSPTTNGAAVAGGGPDHHPNLYGHHRRRTTARQFRQDVAVVITGTNDGPTIVTGSTTASGGVTEDSNIVSAAISAPRARSTFQDVDLIDTHTASFALKSTSATADLPGFAEVTVRARTSAASR